jgi:hypothetical protein
MIRSHPVGFLSSALEKERKSCFCNFVRIVDNNKRRPLSRSVFEDGTATPLSDTVCYSIFLLLPK